MDNYFMFNVGAENVTNTYEQIQIQRIEGQLYTLECKYSQRRHVFETATYERDVVIKTFHKDKPSMHRAIWDKSRVEW